MARFRYQHIKSSVEGKAPTAAQLKVAEIGVNDFAGDEKLFIKNSTGDVVDFPRGYSREYIDDNERVVAEALNDLNTRKLDASAYTPTDLSNYYQKSETSGATELSDEFALYVNKTEVDQVIDETTSASTNPVSSKAVYKAATDNELVWTNAFVALSGTVSAHTANTEIHVTAADKAAWDAKLDASDLDDYYEKTETSGATELSTEFAKYYTTAQTSGATELDTAFGDIDDKFGSGFTVSSVTQVIEENEEIVSGALNDLNARKLDASAYTPTDLTNYYTKSETSGATELQTALAAKQDVLTEGRAIDITNNVVSLDLPISAGTGTNSIIEGTATKASGSCSHAEGGGTTASGGYSHAEGGGTTASGVQSHAEGSNTKASGAQSHAEGASTTASGDYSHAEGGGTKASGAQSHAEGGGTTASGASSHAEGASTTASGDYSHAEGSNTTASGASSHAEGYYTVTNNQAEHASGQYNVSSSASTTFGNSGNTLFSVGNGTSISARHNAFEIRQNGDIYISSGGTNTNPMIKLQALFDRIAYLENKVIYNGHEYVDIGGLKWATMNIGASQPSDYGLYFAWGDTQGYTAEQVGSDEGQKYFGWADYKYGNGTSSPGATGMTKYNATDGKTVLEASDDAAVANWGGSWRMPTTAEFQALGAAVNTAWTQVNNVYGILCTDKTDSSKTLFFPAAADCDNGSVRDVGNYGYYWSSSLHIDFRQYAYYLVFDSDNASWGDNFDRYCGFAVRPVVG